MIYKIFFSCAFFTLIHLNVFAKNTDSCEQISYKISPNAWGESNRPFGYEAANWIEPPFYQVTHTKQYLAIKELEKEKLIKITEDDAKYYTGKYYKAQPNSSPYLVRGIFDNPSGRFFVGWWAKEKHLEVAFSSLGKGGTVMFSPLIVQLPDKPESLSVVASGAM